MAIDVTVLRVFTDSDGQYGNPLGVVDAAVAPPSERQRIATQLGYSETIFVDFPATGASTAKLQIFTPATELPFAGHPTVGASWYLRELGTPVKTLQVAAGIVQVTYHDDIAAISARAEWAPEFALHPMADTDELFAAEPADYSDDTQHYLWTWLDEPGGTIRARMFAASLGVPEDEATGAAAVRITDVLSRDLHIIQGKGSVIQTTWSPQGWVGVAGRAVIDGTVQTD